MQVLPHAPQLFGSDDVLMHALLQTDSELGQPHVPPLHWLPAMVHALPHAPQLFMSVSSFTHAYEQQIPEVCCVTHDTPSAPVLLNAAVLIAGAHVWHEFAGLGAPAG
jgi:hypothetical protein